ncbi:MAG: aldehyde dehydrogenase [Bdellovibrio sp. ArHS]|uniref:aldehyde dehydrogenase family protein n=1 Tax=Bdellovibrio sp. ArHS TaxID=1569284 RepID=UPI00058303CF|nr:aldehyde dehydrogenase family protein [Bdellovibrio sp. ArHS]KHD89594.1 MAG: aldehyde dehydrogenase [Bdellovibrio sp. ArHS]
MLEQIFLHQKQFSLQLRKESLKTRLESLNKLEEAIRSHLAEIIEALAKDFQKPAAETLLSEVYPTLHEIHFAKSQLKKWTRPRTVKTPFLLMGSTSKIHYEPRGVCLIIAPWNYPFQLTLAPLISALAAGNCAILKPSEYTTHTSRLLKKLIDETFAPEYVKLIEGGPETNAALLSLPFDHIFFTGSTRVGKIVMEAASKHLTSVTLELGGKSPTIVDASANLALAAEKIAWGKFLNAGQTCVAPDYILVQNEVLSEFKAELFKHIEGFYGKTPDERRKSPHFARIISTHHTQRLANMLKEAQKDQALVSFGGDVDIENHYIAPTVLEKVDAHNDLMKEEIFGPLLPLVPYKDITEAIHYINEREKPLSLYIYSNSKLNIERVLNETSSGGVCVNDSILHFMNPHMPFGGIGHSGMGSSHGFYGFRNFSHEKAVLTQSWLGRMTRLIYPPYSDWKLKLIRLLLKWKL